MRIALLFVLASGCASFRSTARDAFVHDATCPADRVTVVQAAPEPPPADVAADPGRLAVWNADAEKRAESQFVARGCGQEIRYACETRYAGEGRYQSSYPACESGANYRASYSFSAARVTPPAGGEQKVDVPLVIVLDPAQVRDRWKMQTAERSFELTDFREFVSRDLRAAMAPFFSDVRVVAPDEPLPSTRYVRADVRVDDVTVRERIAQGMSYAKVAMTWSLTMRDGGAPEAAFSYRGVATSTEAYPTFESGCAQMARSAESDLLKRWNDQGGTALFGRRG